jgi:hypothetical protein
MSALALYCGATGTLYYLSMNDRRQDACLICGMVVGIVTGLLIGLDPEGILLSVLPGFILVALLIGCCRPRPDTCGGISGVESISTAALNPSRRRGHATRYLTSNQALGSAFVC